MWSEQDGSAKREAGEAEDRANREAKAKRDEKTLEDKINRISSQIDQLQASIEDWEILIESAEEDLDVLTDRLIKLKGMI